VFQNDMHGDEAAAGEDSGWGLCDEELVRAQRIADEKPNAEDLDWLCRGFSAFLAGAGSLPLERCLRLPTNARALRRARRDHWLRTAWQQINPALSPWRRSESLAHEVHRFAAGKWPRWSALERAPTASALDEALFEAFRSHERVPTTAMQLHNIASQYRGAFKPKQPAVTFCEAGRTVAPVAVPA
jgi:hypothetical protein